MPRCSTPVPDQITYLTDRQWSLIAPLFPPAHTGRGRPPLPDRQLFDALCFYIIRGASWRHIPPGFPSHVTCYRRYYIWLSTGAWSQALAVLFTDFITRTGFDLYQSFPQLISCDPAGNPISFHLPSHLPPSDAFILSLFVASYPPRAVYGLSACLTVEGVPR